jgi:hypothetical protein
MKNKLTLILGGLFLFFSAATAMAATTFTVSATVPLATGVGFTVSSVNASTNVFTTEPPGFTALNFGTLVYTNVGTAGAPSYIFLPSVYYAIDIAVTGGAGAPDTTVSYTAGSVPTGATSTLGVKGTAMFVKEVYTGPNTPPTESSFGLAKQRFVDLSALHIPYTDVTNGWLRAYIGIWNGNTTQTYPDPTNGQPFTAADAAGTYTGTLTFTETVN